MRTWQMTHGVRTNDDGTLVHSWWVDIHTQPAWRVLVAPVLHWVNCHMPRWSEPGRSFRRNPDGTLTLLWRLKLELWLGFGFERKGRRHIETVRVADRDPDTWWKHVDEPPH